LIDIATLTGAIKLALGTKISGLFCNHDSLSRKIVNAGNNWGDPSWRMPLFEGYRNDLRSTAADISNAASTRFGGAITAALFLQHSSGTARAG
jgi:leucyl aminopeptidase